MYYLYRYFHLFVAILCFSTHSALEGSSHEKAPDFCLVSMPKCGTHLCTKLLEMLTDRNKRAVSYLNSNMGGLTDDLFEAAIIECRANNCFLYGHTNPLLFGPYFFRYASAHPQTVVFCPVRDLRDMIISYIFHKHDHIQAELGGNATFEEMLTHILNPNISICGKLVEIQAQFCLNFFPLPHVMVLHFEDLVGPQGGGLKKKQKNMILKIAGRLKISLTKQKLNYIADNLFGNEKKDDQSNSLPPAGTFRSGQIGSWRHYFTPEHEALFKDYWGTYQSAFGYPLD